MLKITSQFNSYKKKPRKKYFILWLSQNKSITIIFKYIKFFGYLMFIVKTAYVKKKKMLFKWLK